MQSLIFILDLHLYTVDEAIKPLLLLQELEEEESSSNAPPALDDTELLLLLDSISHLTHIASQLESLKQVLGISSNSTPTTTTPATASSAANMPLLDESTRLFTKCNMKRRGVGRLI